MSVSFNATLRALERESTSASLWAVCLAALFIGVWTLWLTLAQVTVYETSGSARLEAARASAVIRAPVPGVIASAGLTLGQSVMAGETLFELDGLAEGLARKVDRARLEARVQEMTTLQHEISAAQAALEIERHAASARMDEARSQVRSTAPVARLHHVESECLQSLLEQNRISESDFERRRSETGRGGTIACDVSASDARRLAFEAAVEASKRRVTSPVDGVVGEIAMLRPGGFVDEGTVLAAIVPVGRLRAIADFPASTATERIRPGQQARIRLQSLPWSRYGSVTAMVKGIASEPEDGRVRVELAIVDAALPMEYLQHGLMADVDVELGKVRPIDLLVRATGRVAGTAAGFRPKTPQ